MKKILLYCGLILSSFTHSQESLSFPKAFTATYDAQWLPVALKGSAVRTLKFENSGRARLRFEGKILGTLIQEETQLHWNGCLPVPSHYSRSKSNLLRNSIIDEQVFDWTRQQVVTRHKDDNTKLSISAPSYDPLSVQLALRCDLIADRKSFEYTVIYKQKLNRYVFKVIGTEKLQTPLGLLSTIKVIRSNNRDGKQTSLWFAPQLDYALVRLEQKEVDNKHYVISLRSLQIK